MAQRRFGFALVFILAACGTATQTAPDEGGAHADGGRTGEDSFDAPAETSVVVPDPCAGLGCSAPPLCSTGCTARCGCCPCRDDETLATEGGALRCVQGCFDDVERPTCTSDAGAVVASAAGCGANEFFYSDFGCQAPSPSLDGSPASPCVEQGDHRCYELCATDADCTDPCHPFCSTLGLFDHSDYGCETKVKVCRAQKRNDCM